MGILRQSDAAAHRVLLLSWELPPSPSGSAIIVGNLAKQFSRNEMVLAGEEPACVLHMRWKDEWPEIHHVVSRWTRRGRRMRRYALLPLTIWRCVRLMRRYQCDAIVAVFPKEDFLLVGYITARLTGARFFPYMHNTYVENANGLVLRVARWLQSRAFRLAERVLVMSEGMAELYRERYPKLDCRSLIHSFNEDVPDFQPPPAPGTPFRFVISGHIHDSCIDATARICSTLAPMPDAELTFLSGTPRSDLERWGLMRLDWKHRTVSRDEMIANLQQADVVVLPHGFTGGFAPEEYRTIMPTKLIEYLISGRPILAHTPPECYLTRFLREHDCALIVDEATESALRQAIERIRSDGALRERLVRNALRTAELFHAPRVASAFRNFVMNAPEREMPIRVAGARADYKGTTAA